MESRDKILIVEDNAIVAADIKARVTGLGYEVTDCVARGETAVATALETSPDLILMDIKLKSEMSGIEAAARVRAQQDIPVIFLTSYTDDETLQRAKATDPYGYIVKPFEDNELRTNIEISLHKHRSERRLREKEQWLQTTLDSIGDGVIATDMEGLVTFMNPVAEELTGWQEREMTGKPVEKVFNIINEYTRAPAVNPVHKVLKSGLTEGLANHTLLIRKDGRELPIKDSGAPIVLDNDDFIGVVLVFRDDSESRAAEKQLKESKKKYQSLFEHAPLPYQSLDVDGYFIEVNNAWLEQLGYEREEVLGNFFGNFLHDNWQAHFAENFPRFKSIGEVLGVEFEMRRKDGSFVTVRFNGKIAKDSLGGFIQTHCVFRDVTKEVQLQRKLEAQEATIRQNQKLEAMGTLAGGIAHDFNNILAAVIGYTELSLGGVEEGSELYDNMSEVYAAGTRAKELVKQILTFSQQGDEEKKPIDLSPLVQEAVKMLRSTTPTTIELIEKIEVSRGIISGNSSQLNQVLVNLITNAVHAIDENGKVEVGLEQVRLDEQSHGHLPNLKEGTYLRLFVSDNGRGIAREHLSTIFDPYFTTKPPDKGSGLGLAVVHGIVTSHKGYLDVTSVPGEGTTFDVFLPAVQLREHVTAISRPTDVCGGEENILVVDDEPALAIILQRNLQRLGYMVTCCYDGTTALAKVEEEPEKFDLLITDMTMPGPNGLRLAEEVKILNPQIKVILCTGYSEDINIDTWQSTVLDGLFMKPVENEKLTLSVRKLLDSGISASG